MQEQINRFEKITQQFGSDAITTYIVNKSLTMGDVVEIDGTINGIDLNYPIVAPNAVKGFGKKFTDGFYEYYTVRDMRDIYVESASEQHYLYRHDSINAFTNYISNDASIISKYAVTVKNLICFGKNPTSTAAYPSFNANAVVTNNIMLNSNVFVASVSGYPYASCKFTVNGADNAYYGSANVSDIYLDIIYAYLGTDEKDHMYDIVFDIEFKRIIA